jgi:curli biogenesis system outer membrane secretion channel CsgG
VEYVFEPTISEGKAKTNVLGFLKDTVGSNAPLSLDVRVFDPKTATLVSMVTVNSADIKSEKVGLADINSMMAAVGVGGGQQSSESLKLEELLGGVMLHAANRLANQLGGSGMGTQRAAGSPRTPFTR